MAKRYRRARRYARRVYGRARRSASKMTIPLAVVGGVAGMPAITLMINDIKAGAWEKIPAHMGEIAGVTSTGVFSFPLAQKNLMPLLAGALVHKAAGIVGVNRMLGRAKIPIIRV